MKNGKKKTIALICFFLNVAFTQYSATRMKVEEKRILVLFKFAIFQNGFNETQMGKEVFGKSVFEIMNQRT